MQAVRDDSASRTVLAWVLVVISILMATGSIGLWVYSAFSPGTAASTQSTLKKTAQSAPTPTRSQQASATTNKYMQAFLTRNYATMWTMLHPQMQATWPNQASFETYWQHRFQDYTLQKFTLGTPSQLEYWTNPETMTRYDKVMQIPVSLTMVSKQGQGPPQGFQPDQLFQHLPFIVQYATDGADKGKWLVLAGGPADVEAPILPPLTAVQKTIQVPILMYHHVSVPVTQSALDVSLAVEPELFKQQLAYLKKQGYHSITFNQLFSALYYDGPLPTKPIILSFDDGYDDIYTNVYPMLKEQGFSGMFYIITGKVGWKGQATWPQLREMMRNGMQMGSHTINHGDLGQILQVSQAQAQQELHVSQSTLQGHLGVSIQQFCYPAGEPFRNYSVTLQQEIIKLLTADGYVGATLDPGGQTPSGTTQNSQAPYKLLRLRIDGRATLQAFMDTFSA
jgi:peptidoglycan/xylan/chitin deacetylase (PgdA/CDA1 family)